MQKRRKTLLVDGYNVIRRVPEFERHDRRKLEAGREALIRRCAEWKSRRPDIARAFIVFDGDSSVCAPPSRAGTGGVRIVFTETGEPADSRIASLVEEMIATDECTVVSDDLEVARRSKQLGADVMSAMEFHAMISPRRAQAERSTSPEATKSSLSAREEREITESLIREWGVE